MCVYINTGFYTGGPPKRCPLSCPQLCPLNLPLKFRKNPYIFKKVKDA